MVLLVGVIIGTLEGLATGLLVGLAIGLFVGAATGVLVETTPGVGTDDEGVVGLEIGVLDGLVFGIEVDFDGAEDSGVATGTLSGDPVVFVGEREEVDGFVDGDEEGEVGATVGRFVGLVGLRVDGAEVGVIKGKPVEFPKFNGLLQRGGAGWEHCRKTLLLQTAPGSQHVELEVHWAPLFEMHPTIVLYCATSGKHCVY